MTLRTKIPVFALAVLCAAPCFAQWTYKLPLPNSAYWWTLTDEVSPQELRQQFNPANKRARYLEAVAADLYEPLPDYQLNDILVFADGRARPEFIRLPNALGLLCDRLVSPHRGDHHADLLLQAGFTQDEVQVIAEAAGSRESEINEAVAENREAVRKWLELMELSVDAYGPLEHRNILRGRRYGKLAQISDYSPQEIREFAEAWNYEPIAEFDVSTAVLLKEVLAPERWEKLRRYLFEEIAPELREFELGNGVLEAQL